MVASLQPTVVGEVLVLLEYFLSDPLQLIRAGMACRQIVWPPTSHSSRRQIAAFSRSPETVMRRAFCRDYLLKSRATLAFVEITTFL